VATIIRTITIDSDPATCWDALRDFCALHQRLAPGFVTGSRMEGADIRAISFFTGAIAKERLIGIDDDARRLAYSIIESSLGLTHHNGAAQITDTGDGRTRFTWTVDVLPDERAAPLARMMDAGLTAIKANLEQQPVTSC
jgi:hypothetical protein